MTLQEHVIAIVASESDTPMEKLTPESKFSDLKMDSLDFVAMMLAIESEIRKVPEVRWTKLQTVGDVIDELQVTQ